MLKKKLTVDVEEKGKWFGWFLLAEKGEESTKARVFLQGCPLVENLLQ